MNPNNPVIQIRETRRRDIWLTMAVTLLTLGACGGGSSTEEAPPAANLECDPNNTATHAECGSVLVALTDADGDFLNYTVDITSLTLETANGRIVETLPRSTRINFTDYVELTELVAIAAIPPATYVAGTISIDYSDAEVFVEENGASKATIVTDADGNPLGQSDLKITLSNRDRLTVVRGRSALLQLDFDLEASHVVDAAATPATAVSEQFIVAEVSPVDEKDFRARGPLTSIDENEMSYSVNLRPFHDREGDFGEVQVFITDDTEFAVNEIDYVGIDGLRALGAAGIGTPTVAQGTLDTSSRTYTANTVLAGSSVPGIELDAVRGNVIARTDNQLTVRGATIMRADQRAHFHDDVIVDLGLNTKVFKDGHRGAELSITDISIGQRVTVRGEILQSTSDASSTQIQIDATAGAVRMHVTHLLGTVNTTMTGQTDITLHGIDRRRAGIFDFTGTGVSPELDADPNNYEVSTGTLPLAALSEGKPIVAWGFPSAFGMAPADFDGRTVIDYTNVRSAMGIGWGSDGTTAPFSSINSDGLVVDIANPDIGARHHIKSGPLLVDLTTLNSDTTIVPRAIGRSLFYLKSNDSLRQYSEFADFIEDLSLSLDGATAARSMHARGYYDADTNTLHARKIGVYLLEP